MHRDNIAENLLVLFTSRPRAEALVGDVLEEGAASAFAFWFYVVQTIVRLFWEDVVSLSHKSVLFFFAAFVGQVAVVSVSPFLTPARGWAPTTHELEWCISMAILGQILSPFFVGLVVSGLSREHESTACIAMAVVVEGALLLCWITVGGIAESAIPLTRFLLLNLTVPIVLVAIGVFMRKKRLRAVSELAAAHSLR